MKLNSISFIIPFICVCCSASFTQKRFLQRSNYAEFDFNKNIDAELTTPQMIRKAGYNAEAHTVETYDGYLLTIHRIRGKKSSPSIFLQHGLLGSSADWVIPSKEHSLAYILADNGYDVWLGNFRGNTYSKAHVNLSVTDSKFWNFSWHELGIYDLPSMISYVVNLKKAPLMAYIGHSMGTSAFYVMASTKLQIAQSVKMMFSLAPVAFMQHLKSPVKFLAPFAHDYEVIAHFLGKDEFLPQNSLLRFLARFGCDVTIWEERICANSLFVICGFDATQFNYTLLPVILSHSPAGASTKTVIHYAQEIESGYFRAYDYGPKRNSEIYNTTVPPNYNLSAISIPITLFYAENDWLASPVDVLKLAQKLRTVVDVHKVTYPKFNHLDFIWGADATELVYKPLLRKLQKHSIPRNRWFLNLNLKNLNF